MTDFSRAEMLAPQNRAQLVEPEQTAAELEILKGSRGAAGAWNGPAGSRQDHGSDQQGREDVSFRKGDLFRNHE